jgi:cytochrome P450
MHYEQYVEAVQSIFQERLSEISRDGRQVDLHHWLQCYAFDVVGNITYGRRFGFLDEGKDVGKMIGSLHSTLEYSTLIGIYSWAHKWVYKFGQKIPGSGAAGRAYLASTVRKELDQRVAQRSSEEKDGGRAHDLDAPRDFLDLALDAEKDPEKGMTMRHVYAMLLSNVVAGSDTTAVSLSSVIFYVARDRRVLARLREELDQAVQDGRATADRIAFKETQDMPYFQACIKEGLRLTAATGLPLWRVVPAGGVEMLGHFFPEGTEVGINTWLAHYNEEVWGKDAAEFKPERWLNADADKLKLMDNNYMPVSIAMDNELILIDTDMIHQFGLGSRTCIGRHISYLEMCKVIPMILLQFDIELVNSELTTKNLWFVKPTNFCVRLRKRQA